MKKIWKAGIRAQQKSGWFTQFVKGGSIQTFREKHGELGGWIEIYKEMFSTVYVFSSQAGRAACVGSVPAPGWSWSCPLHSQWESVSPAGGPSPQWCVCTQWGPRCSPLSELSPASYWPRPIPWWPGGWQSLREQREKSSITPGFFLFVSEHRIKRSCSLAFNSN